MTQQLSNRCGFGGHKRQLARHPTVDSAVSTKKAKTLRLVQVPAADIINGQLLRNLAESHLKNFKELTQDKAPAPPRIITWASLCSGSEGIHFVMEAMQEAYRAAGIQVTLQQQISCEIDEENQNWILE